MPANLVMFERLAYASIAVGILSDLLDPSATMSSKLSGALFQAILGSLIYGAVHKGWRYCIWVFSVWVIYLGGASILFSLASVEQLKAAELQPQTHLQTGTQALAAVLGVVAFGFCLFASSRPSSAT
jgi:hypothetical protein